MQTIKPRRELNITLGLPIIIICLLATIFIPHQLMWLGYANWLAVAAILGCLISPIGKIRLGIPSSSTLKIPPLFFRIACLQLSLYVWQNLTIVASHHFFSSRSTFVSAETPSSTLHHLYQQFLLHNGLYPWPIIIMVAIGLGFYAFCQQKNAYISTLFNPLIKKTPKDAFGIVVNMIWRLASLFALCTSLMITAFSCSTLLANALSLPAIYGYTPMTVLLIILVFFLLISKRSNQRLTRLIQAYPNKNYMAVLLLFIGLILFLIVMAAINHAVEHSINTMQSTPPNWVNANRWKINELLYSLLWWGAWIPISAIFLATSAQGHRIITVIGLSLIVPILILIATMTLPQSIANLAYQLTPLSIVSFITSCLSIYLLLQAKYVRWFQWTFLPKRTRHQTKHNKPKLIKKIIIFNIFILVAYLYTGILFITFVAGQLTLSCLIVTIGCIGPIFYALCTYKHLKKNQH